MAGRVAIIGAGASGLPAIKCCLDEGLQPVCFERTYSIGGLWNFKDEIREGQSSVMETTVINTSKEMTCYSDYPMPKDFPNYCHNTKLMEYFTSYCHKFGLHKYIRFKNEVLAVKKSIDFSLNGKWDLRIRDTTTMQETEERFDFILVCTGHHADTKIVNFDGQNLFKGVILHSHDLKRGTDFRSQRVVVIGAGNSAMDAAAEIAPTAKQVFLSTRRGAWVFPRLGFFGTPIDIYNSRLYSCLGYYFPNVIKKATILHANQRFDHALYGLQPVHAPNEAHPSVSDFIPGLILRGAVIVKPDVKRFTKYGVEFVDGTSEDNIDAIITCTGYVFGFPFIDKSVINVKDNQVELYKYMFPPDLEKNTLAVIGCIQPTGSVIPIAEMQSRLATRVFKGLVKLPSRDLMRDDIRQKQVAMEARYVKSTRHTIQVDLVPYMDELAHMVGCKPNLWRFFFQNHRLWRAIFLGPCTPVQFRLHGPGKWSKAEATILETMDRVRCPFKTRPIKDHKADDRNLSSRLLQVAFVAVAVVVAGILLLIKNQDYSIQAILEGAKEFVTNITMDNVK